MNGLLDPNARALQLVGSQQVSFPALADVATKVAQATSVVMAQAPQFDSQQAAKLVEIAVFQQASYMTAQLSYCQNERIHQETEANKERRHQEKLRAKNEVKDWGTRLSKVFDDTLRQVSTSSCCVVAIVSLQLTIGPMHAALMSAYNKPITFMNDLICGVASSQVEDQEIPEEPVAEQTWNDWFTSSTKLSSYYDPIAFMEKVTVWLDATSKCPRSYAYWISFLTLSLIVIGVANQFPYFGQWINPICTIMAIALSAKNVLPWHQLWYIVVGAFLYAAAFALGLFCYYMHSRAMLNSLGRDPYMSELNKHGIIFENIKMGLILAQLTIVSCFAIQCGIMSLNQ